MCGDGERTGRRVNVLVVEDSEEDSELILRQLREDGYEASAERVESAEAMRAALESRSWDLIIADYTLPRFDALAALRVLQATGRDVPFIIVSGAIGRTVGEEAAVEAMAAGAHDYVLKSNLRRLGPAVERELREAQVRAERRQARESLERLNVELERRVAERTSQLDRANRELADAVVRERAARESAEATARRLWALQSVADAALLELSLDEVLGELMWRIRTVLTADIATLLLLTEDGQRLTVRASSGLEEEVRARIEVPIGSGIAGRIAATGKPLVVEDLSQAEVVSPLLREKARSLLGVPLRIERRVIGVIHVATLARRHFDEDDVRLLQLVADRVAAAIARRRDEEIVRKLSTAVEQSPVVVIITDSKGSIEYVNPRFSELTGYSAQEVLGRNPRFLKGGHTSPEEYKSLWQTITSGRLWRGHFQNKKKSGELYWESASIAPITDVEGKITHFVAMKQDITMRKQAEAERDRLEGNLRRANEELVVSSLHAQALADAMHQRAAEIETVITAMADPVIICDANGVPVRVNPAATAACGIDLVGLEWESIIQRLSMRGREGRPATPGELPAALARLDQPATGQPISYTDAAGRDHSVLASAASFVTEGEDPAWSSPGTTSPTGSGCCERSMPSVASSRRSWAMRPAASPCCVHRSSSSRSSTLLSEPSCPESGWRARHSRRCGPRQPV